MISVVMATYNGEVFIEKQMESIRNQTLPADEVLFCDDNSSDNTVNIIKTYIKKHKLNNWNLIINENNLGYYINFINGAHLAKGDTIYFADQDDIWNTHKIEACENIFNKSNNIMMVQTNYVFIDQDDNKLPIDSNYHRIHSNKKTIEVSLKDMCRFAGSGFTMGFRRDVVSFIYSNELYKVNEFCFHDILVGLSAVCLGKCIYLSNIYDKHRLHLHNATQKSNESVTESRTKAIQTRNFQNRKIYFTAMKDLLTKDYDIDDISKKVYVLNKFIYFNGIRSNYYNTRKIKYFVGLLKNIECYYEWKAIFADILFAFNANGMVNKYSKNRV